VAFAAQVTGSKLLSRFEITSPHSIASKGAFAQVLVAHAVSQQYRSSMRELRILHCVLYHPCRINSMGIQGVNFSGWSEPTSLEPTRVFQAKK
jgi:hypothetical protein